MNALQAYLDFQMAVALRGAPPKTANPFQWVERREFWGNYEPSPAPVVYLSQSEASRFIKRIEELLNEWRP